MKNGDVRPYYPHLLRMEAMSPGSDDDNNSPERHHRDDAETIDKLTKERFRLQLRIYHMEEQMKETHGADWKSSLNQKIELEECRVELEEKLKLLTQSAKMIEQLKIQLTTSETAKQKLTEERDNALRDVSNIEVKYRRIEEENTRLLEDLKSAQSQSRRNREKINLDFEDNENRLRQSERSLRDVENRLNDSQSENDRLHEKLQDLQNNNNSIDDELNRKYEEVNNLKEDNDELIEEVERLREDLGRAQQEREKHRRRKYNVFEVGVQCETRMCEKAVQTKSISTSSLRESSSTTIASSNHLLRSSNNHTSSTTTRNPSSSRMTNSSLRRTSSVDNLSSRPNLLAKYTQQSSPVSSSSTRDRYKQSYGDRDRGGAAPVQSYNDRYAEPASRYQTLVQSQSRDLGLLRRQLEQSRMTTTKLRNIIEDLTRSDQTVDQRRYIQLARRTIRKLEGELEDRGESATSECNSDSDFEKEENQHIKSRLLPAVLEIKTMVNDLRDRQNDREQESIRSICSNSTISLNNLNQKVQESKRLSRNIQDAFDMDSGKATSPLDTFGSMSGLNEAQLIPGLVQDLQSLRLKLDTSVKRSEMLTEQYMSKMDRTNQQQRHVKTAEFACQTELQGQTIASYQDEITALRSFLTSKDDEISKLKQESLEHSLTMAPPMYQSSPNEHKIAKSRKMKPALHDSHLTPPTSDHQSGDDNSVCNVEVNSLAQCLSRTRDLTRSLTKRIETDHEIGTMRNMASYDLRQIVSALDDMNKAVYKIQHSNEIETSRNENARLKQKVKQLEALLARSCERIRSNNALKNGLEYQMASKLSKVGGMLSRARTNLGTTTPSTSRATSLAGDLESC